MSAEQPPYNRVYLKAWIILSVILGLFLLSLFLVGDHLRDAGHIVWDLIRWLASPII